ncbi:MAG: hypothetical protein IJG32_01315 [Selenomonadaceae bacterium]|nr:hypothetical protein [Selenomonadaceae bacterium]
MFFFYLSLPTIPTKRSLGIYVDNVNIYGVQVNATSRAPTYICGQVKYNGGTNGIYASSGSITLGWKKTDDYVNANSYTGTVNFVKRFYDMAGNINSTSGGKLIVTLGVNVENKTPISDTYTQLYTHYLWLPVIDGLTFADGDYYEISTTRHS